MPEAKVALAAVAVAALLIGLIAGYYIIPPRTLTETVISTETAKATETVKVTETKLVSSEVTRTLRVTETVSIPTTVVKSVTHVLETMKLLRSEAACINGFCPMPPGYLYLIRGEFREVEVEKFVFDVDVVKADVVELKPECCLHGIPYVKLPPLKGGEAFLIWRALVMPPHNLSVAHMVWVLPADGEIMNHTGYGFMILPYNESLKQDVPVLAFKGFYIGSGGFVDMKWAVRDSKNLEKATERYLRLFIGETAFIGEVDGEPCGPVSPYCLCCMNVKDESLLHEPRIAYAKVGTPPIETLEPIALLNQSRYWLWGQPSYSAAPLLLASAVPLYRVPEDLDPLRGGRYS